MPYLAAYEFVYKKDDNMLKLDFDNNKIKEIKFDIKINGQRNFGIINYHNDEVSLRNPHLLPLY